MDETTPIQMCLKYSEGGMSREEILEYLKEYPYASNIVIGQDEWGVNEYEYPPGSFIEVVRAHMRGYIDISIYEELFQYFMDKKDGRI